MKNKTVPLDWLKEIRLREKMTGKAVGEASGISESYYLKIENGERGKPLNVNMAKVIAKTLNFDWTRFYEDSELKSS